MPWTWVAAAVALAGTPEIPFVGPDHAELDLIRPFPGATRIYVQATYPDGTTGLFLVDTGADISVLHRSVAERLGLGLREGCLTLNGLSGRDAGAACATLPEIALGGMTVPEVQVAVDVSGVPDTAGYLPLDGLLGNPVWSRFVLEIDYPADVLVLHRPGTVRLPRRQQTMFYDGHHVFTPVEITAAGDPPRTATIVAQVDTGAGDLIVCAASGLPFADVQTEGLEELRGIGASETLPPFRFLTTTRRVDVVKVGLGGRSFPLKASARWIDFDRTHTGQCRSGGFRALLGHQYLADHRVIFDFQQARIALAPSRRPSRQIDGHALWLAQDRARFGSDDTVRAAQRAKWMVGTGDLEGARALLMRAADIPGPDSAERWVLLARLHREGGDLDAAWEAIRHLSPEQLVDEGEIVATVNGLLYASRTADAHALAVEAVAARPDDGWAHVALADVLLFEGDTVGASDALGAAARIEAYPDAHLLRRARVALAARDRFGAMAHVRKLLQLYPMGGEFLWFYALLVEDSDRGTFRHDLEAAMARLHPGRRPIDFRVAAYRILGDEPTALALMHEGVEAHCDPMDAGPERDNCHAWYHALAGQDLDGALRNIERALAEAGPRSDFLDTFAMVHLARGDLNAAHDAAWAAARLSPDDVYMLWQAERIGDLLRAAEEGSAHAAQDPATVPAVGGGSRTFE